MILVPFHQGENSDCLSMKQTLILGMNSPSLLTKLLAKLLVDSIMVSHITLFTN